MEKDKPRGGGMLVRRVHRDHDQPTAHEFTRLQVTQTRSRKITKLNRI